MHGNTQTLNPTLHVRFDGRSWDVAQAQLDLGTLSSDEQVRAALARYLEVPAAALEAYVVERHANGNLTLRPQAVFG